MKLSKKTLGLFLLGLVVILGTVTIVAAPPDGVPLWERFWRVEQPVEVTGEVKTANLTTTTITRLGFHLNEYDNGDLIGFGQEAIFQIKVDGLRRVNVWYDEKGPGIPEVMMSVFWQVEVDSVLLPNELPAGDLSESGIFSSDVKGSVLRIVVWTTSVEHWIGPLDVIVYAW